MKDLFAALRNAGWIAGGSVLGRLLSGLGYVVAARRIGPGPFGVIVLASTLVNWFAVVAAGGVSTLGLREFTGSHRASAETAGALLFVRLVTTAVSTVLLLALLATGRVPDRIYVLAFAAGMVLTAVDPSWILQGTQQGLLAGIGSLLQGATFLVIVIATVHPQSSLGVPAALAASSAIASGVLWLLVSPDLRPRLVPPRQVLRLAQSGGTVVLAELLVWVSTTSGVFWLGWLSKTAAVGIYGAAFRLVGEYNVLIAAWVAGYSPLVARQWRSHRDEVAGTLGRLLELPVSAGVIMIAGALWSSESVMTFVFGRAYASGGVVLAILVGATALAGTSAVLGNALVAIGGERSYATAMGVGAAVAVVGNVLLVGPLGMVGAAVVNLAAQVATAAVVLFSLLARVPGSLRLPPGPVLWAVVGAAMCMIADRLLWSLEPSLPAVLTIMPFGLWVVISTAGVVRTWQRA